MIMMKTMRQDKKFKSQLKLRKIYTFFIFWLCCAACGILVLRQGLNACPLHWERGVSIPRLPGKSRFILLSSLVLNVFPDLLFLNIRLDGCDYYFPIIPSSAILCLQIFIFMSTFSNNSLQTISSISNLLGLTLNAILKGPTTAQNTLNSQHVLNILYLLFLFIC